MDKRKNKFVLTMIIATILLIISLIISMNTGYIRLSTIDVIKTLFGFGTDKQKLILFGFRLPRIVIGMFAGAGLAVSGSILQSVYNNPLADSSLLGINAGAGLAMVLYVAFFPSIEKTPAMVLPLVAFFGAFFTSISIYFLANKKGEGITPIRLVLVGIAISAAINALMVVITIRLDPRKFDFTNIWLSGSIWASNWSYVMALLPWIIIFIPLAIYKSNTLNMLNLSEEVSISLGVDIIKERKKMLFIATALAGASVAVSGGISFLGLVAPHLSRRIVGSKNQYVIALSAVIGALILVFSDILARSVLIPSEIPTGIVVSIIGAPYFLYLLSKT